MKTSFAKNKKGQKQQSAISIFIFLFIVTVLYGLAFLSAPERSMSALLFGLKILAKLGPVLLLVFFLMFLTNLFIKPNWIRQYLGHDSSIKGFLVAIVGGIISMGPVYVWYGMLKDFHKKGMRPALIAVFLYSRSVKLPLLPLMVYYFGLAYTVILSFYMILFSVVNGILTEWLTPENKGNVPKST